jgi:hypothetical protein
MTVPMIKYILIITMILFYTGTLFAAEKQGTASVKKIPAAPAIADTVKDTVRDLPVSEWAGKTFVILKKQKVLDQFGYELYLTPELSASKKPLDPAFETTQRHIRSEVFGGSLITAKSAKPVGREFALVFSHAPTGRDLYAQTRMGVLEGLALAADIDIARSWWMGKTVYSARRFLDTYDSVSGKLNNFKAKIDEPLTVTDIRWGLTPLPPKPVWLIVQKKNGESGIIPTSVSWCNIIWSKRYMGAPWESDVLDINLRAQRKWDEVVWETINAHSLYPGMTVEQVRLSWGPPRSIAKDSLLANAAQRWKYDTQTLIIVNDTLKETE